MGMILGFFGVSFLSCFFVVFIEVWVREVGEK